MVDDITEIVWNPSSFDNLAIPATKKNVITALAKAHISRASNDIIDDFVEGKGQGLITLLQYESWRSVLYHRLTYTSSGPPGVGKTLTVEGLSEYLERPLYAVSLALLRLSDPSDFFRYPLGNSARTRRYLKSSCRPSFALLIIGRPSSSLTKPTCLCSHALSSTHITLSCRCSCGNLSTIEGS